MNPSRLRLLLLIAAIICVGGVTYGTLIWQNHRINIQVRQAYLRWWNALQKADYESLYSLLPSGERQNISLMQFAERYQKYRSDMYSPDRIDHIRTYRGRAYVRFELGPYDGKQVRMEWGENGWWIRNTVGGWRPDGWE